MQPIMTNMRVKTARVPSKRSKYNPRKVKKATETVMPNPICVISERYFRFPFICAPFLVESSLTMFHIKDHFPSQEKT